MRRALDQYLDKAIAMKLARRKGSDLEDSIKNEEIFSVEISKEDLAKGTELYNKMPSDEKQKLREKLEAKSLVFYIKEVENQNKMYFELKARELLER